MENRDIILQAVFEAIDALNQLLPEGRRLEKSLDTVLFGRSGTLTSMNLVNLIVETERRLEMALSRPVSLVDKRAMLWRHNPFETVEAFVNHIDRFLEASR